MFKVILGSAALIVSMTMLSACNSAEAPGANAGNGQAAGAGAATGDMAGGMGEGMAGGMGGGEGMGGPPDFGAAAAKLGIDEDTLEAALRAAGGPPPDFAVAAETLGITEQALMDALRP